LLNVRLASHALADQGVHRDPAFQHGHQCRAGRFRRTGRGVRRGRQANATVPGEALTTLNNLVGGISPYGSAGAQALIDSVSEVGASYFAMVSRDQARPWLAVVPLADAVTLPACSWPQNVVFVDALHGGLLGDAPVRQMIEAFFANGTLIAAAAAAAAWRMPDLHPACLT
jgi:hypothetical protein